jgi:hypothetical protein
MPLINPILEERLRRHWQVVLAVVVAVLFTITHQLFFRMASDRYAKAIQRATDLGLAVDPSRPLVVTPPRLLVVLAANMLPANVADASRESGALAASMLEELTQITHRHGMQVVVAEPGITSQETGAVQIRAHLRIQCTYPQFVSFLDDLSRAGSLISVDRFSLVEGRDGRKTLDLWVTRYVIKLAPETKR